MTKIVDIFAPHLYSFVYKKNDTDQNDEYDENEYDRLMDLWTNVDYLWKYAKANKVDNIRQFVQQKLNDAERIQDLLEEITQNGEQLDRYFHPLNNDEYGFKLLGLKKGKVSRFDGLRLYAIKIDDNLFVITGGAIKMSLKMADHPDTLMELEKLDKAKQFLIEQQVFDEDSFFDFFELDN